MVKELTASCSDFWHCDMVKNRDTVCESWHDLEGRLNVNLKSMKELRHNFSDRDTIWAAQNLAYKS